MTSAKKTVVVRNYTSFVENSSSSSDDDDNVCLASLKRSLKTSAKKAEAAVEVTDIESQDHHSYRKPKWCKRAAHHHNVSTTSSSRANRSRVLMTSSDEESTHDVTQSSAVGKLGYDCTICGENFRAQTLLEKHLRLHSTSKFVCEVRIQSNRFCVVISRKMYVRLYVFISLCCFLADVHESVS